jgi:hypothetical protein
MDPALERLRAALEEYLAQGGDTPVAAEAEALMAAIDGGGDPQAGAADALGGGLGELGGMDGGMPPMPEEGVPGGGSPLPPEEEEMPPPQQAKTFEGARSGAKKRLKQLNAR